MIQSKENGAQEQDDIDARSNGAVALLSSATSLAALRQELIASGSEEAVLSGQAIAVSAEASASISGRVGGLGAFNIRTIASGDDGFVASLSVGNVEEAKNDSDDGKSFHFKC